MSFKKFLVSGLAATLLYAVHVRAAPQPSASLVIKTTAGSFRGVSAPGSVDKWLGIPFAQQPLGNLRFKAPKAITNPPKQVIDANQFGPACAQPPSVLGAPIAEDCLHLNIWRPNNVADKKLPVLFWIHPGAYTTNSSSHPAFDPTELIQRSVQIRKPIMFVSINYRLNTFGFLASATMKPRDLNAGFQDQILALNFVQDNIAAFGGDPSKVTIWGQSAGAGSVEAHFLYPTKRNLFRGGIADSSTGPFKSSPPPQVYDEPDKPFTRLLAATGCSPGPSALSCLQQIPFETLMGISNDLITATLNGQLWQPTIGPPGTVIDEEASQRIRSGKFLKLPYLGGTNLNEGTIFSKSLLGEQLTASAQTTAFDVFIGNLVIDNSTLTPDVLQEFQTLFPANDPQEGAPFNTGDSLFDRGEAWYTDTMFLAPRRLFFDQASGSQPMFAYHFREFIPGNDPLQGVAHASELELLFGPIPPVAQIEVEFATQMRDFWINFVNDLNPGGNWERFTPNSKRVLQLLRNNVTMIPDDFDLEETNFINSARVLNELQK